jgi:hypothetical protein
VRLLSRVDLFVILAVLKFFPHCRRQVNYWPYSLTYTWNGNEYFWFNWCSDDCLHKRLCCIDSTCPHILLETWGPSSCGIQNILSSKTYNSHRVSRQTRFGQISLKDMEDLKSYVLICVYLSESSRELFCRVRLMHHVLMVGKGLSLLFWQNAPEWMHALLLS